MFLYLELSIKYNLMNLLLKYYSFLQKSDTIEIPSNTLYFVRPFDSLHYVEFTFAGNNFDLGKSNIRNTR